MLNADIVTGISLMLLFIALKFTLGFVSVLFAHITFNLPYVVLSVMPKIQQTNKNTYEAALDLGASHFYAFRKVIFPDIFPGILSGFLMAFTMSLDDFVITEFTKPSEGTDFQTISTYVQGTLAKGSVPIQIRSFTTLIFLLIVAVMIGYTIVNNRKAKKI